MTFLDFFAGIGGFRKGMELAGHKCIGFCEYNEYSRASYISMHLITEEQRFKLSKLSLKKRQKEILKNEYLNREWCSNDIRTVDATNIPKADCWCFGAPCQDFSMEGKRRGIKGDKSSLIREIFRILSAIPEEDRPEWLIYENVKGMLSSNRGYDFLSILLELDKWGYDIEWQIFNSKDFGVPQDRERVYTIGHLRRKGVRKILPIKRPNGKAFIQERNKIKNDNESCIFIKNATKRGYLTAYSGDSINIAYLNSKTRRGRVKPKIAQTLDTVCSQGVITNGRIRRLTPKECFRLQGWDDEYFQKAKFVNSDKKLYMQAGNGVTINVVKAIAERLENG